MLLNKDWDFETAMYEISNAYRPGGISTGQVRNNLIESWGQLVGKSRAVAEFDSAIEKYGSLSAFGREYSVSISTLRRFREFFENLPDDDTASGIENKVFISYAREDQTVALEIYEFLKSNKCSPWIDVHDLKTGQDWKLEIDQAIQSSNYFVACLSSNSVSKRGYVQKELKSALSVLELMPEGAIYLLPVKLDECTIPHSLSSKQWLDWNALNARHKILEAMEIKVTPKQINNNQKGTVSQTQEPIQPKYQKAALSIPEIKSSDDKSEAWKELITIFFSEKSTGEEIADTGYRLSWYFPSVSDEFKNEFIMQLSRLNDSHLVRVIEAIHGLLKENKETVAELIVDLLRYKPDIRDQIENLLKKKQIPALLKEAAIQVIEVINDEYDEELRRNTGTL